MRAPCPNRSQGWLVVGLLVTGCGESLCGHGGEDTRPGMVIETRDDLAALAGICVAVLGDLEIRGEELTDLDGLEAVYSVDGNLVVDVPGLTSTAGLENLAFVGHELVVKNALQLARVELPELRSIGTHLVYEGLPALTSLEGTPELREIGGFAMFRELDGLVTAELPALRNVGYGLVIQDNAQLEHIVELDTLRGVRGPIDIRNNPHLQSVVGFNALDHVGGEVRIEGNDGSGGPSWSGACDTSGPRTGAISGMLIARNDELECVTGFSSIRRIARPQVSFCPPSLGLSISDNPQLQHLEILPLLREHGAADPENELRELIFDNNDRMVEFEGYGASKPLGLFVSGNAALESIAMPDATTVFFVRITDNEKVRALHGLVLDDGYAWLELVENGSLPTLAGIAFGLDTDVLDLRLIGNARLDDVSGLLHFPGTARFLEILANPMLPQRQAESIAWVLRPLLGHKIAGNAGWVAPEACPFVLDGDCDELPIGGIPICLPDTDTEDCAPP